MMNIEEKKKLYDLADEAEANGDMEKKKAILKQIPIDPSIAMIAKDVYRSKYLKKFISQIK